MAKKKNKKQGIEINVGVCEQTFKKLKVEQRHINKGKQGNPESCPIALAVREALGPDGKDAVIGVSSGDATFKIEKEVSVPVIVCGKEQDEIVKTVHITGTLNFGKKADDFIEAFDGITDEDNWDYEARAGGKDAVKPITLTGKPVFDIEITD